MNEAARTYYQLTEEAYLHLCPEHSGFMNLGLWPAASGREAQAALVDHTLSILSDSFSGVPELVVEAGSGWGGARRLVSKAFPSSQYLGINCSAKQISFARVLNAHIPSTEYRENFLENILAIDLPRGPKVLFAVEAALHVANKTKWLQDLRESGFSAVVFAEICPEAKTKVLANPLFNPGLTHAWSTGEYVEGFSKAGFTNLRVHDLTSSVYDGWRDFICAIDPKSFKGHRRILKQFIDSYSALAEHASRGEVKYVIFEATLNDASH